MQRGLARFARRLRREGLRVSTGEMLDAARVLLADAHAGESDLGDKDLLREALRLALVKRREDFARFDAAFEAHFAPPGGPSPEKKRGRRKGRVAEGGEGGRGRPAGPSVPGLPSPGEPSPLQRLSKLRLPRPRAETPPPAAPGQEAGEEADDHPPTPGEAAAALAELLLGKKEEPEEKGKEKRGEKFACPVLRAERRPPGRRPASVRPVERKDLRGRWTAEDERALADEVERELLRLRMRRVRRKRMARRGALWVQRALRRSVATDGVPMRLPRRRPGRREPRLLLLVDVSGSAARAAAAFLALASRLGESFRKIAVYFYVDGAAEATDLLGDFLRERPTRAALERAAERLPGLNLHALSDMGRALYQVLEREERALRRDTLVLILGDGRNNRLDPCAWALEAMRAKARRVVWLVPEPFREWGTGDSDLPAYSRHCDLMVEAADLAGLKRGLRRAGSRFGGMGGES
ncbi:MAG: VWA domain-containing protein [Candidatus Tectomicrobia bacterium]|uniref:VWA domain-containing protein n=1 Tax=Tectimicrobiota bacterium TaxID=2528274 RepID=A0A932I034_UNCTE|nr:VWA domain-containing protein [Candidatus Tectomicrobia bacterium]